MKFLAVIVLMSLNSSAHAYNEWDVKYAIFEATCKGKPNDKFNADEQKEINELATGIQDFARDPQKMADDLSGDAVGTILLAGVCSGLLEVYQLSASEKVSCVGADGGTIELKAASKVCFDYFKAKQK